MHRRLEQAVAALAVALGDVHRGVGVADQLVGVGAPCRSTTAMPRLQRSVISLRPARSGAASASRMRSAVSAASWRCSTSSSSTANSSPPKRAAVSRAADAARRAGGDLEQHLVPGGVAEAVVDRLEVVEVEEDDGAGRAARGGARAIAWRTRSTNSARLARPGHGVVERLVGELLLERLALADVAAVEHDAADVLVVEQVRVEDLELARAAVAVAQRALERLAPSPASGAVGQQVQQAAVARRARRVVEARADDLSGA